MPSEGATLWFFVEILCLLQSAILKTTWFQRHATLELEVGRSLASRYVTLGLAVRVGRYVRDVVWT